MVYISQVTIILQALHFSTTSVFSDQQFVLFLKLATLLNTSPTGIIHDRRASVHFLMKSQSENATLFFFPSYYYRLLIAHNFCFILNEKDK